MSEYIIFIVATIISVSVTSAIFYAGYIVVFWFLAQKETHIEPISVERQRTHKFPKIDISVAYQNAKVGQVLGGRK